MLMLRFDLRISFILSLFLEEDLHLLVSQMFGKPPGKLHGIWLLHRVDDPDSLFWAQVVVKLADAIEITVDGLRF
jgi:hypothetical protein